MTFTHALTRKPGNSFPFGITTANLGRPNLELAQAQHIRYCEALTQAGLHVDTLPALEFFPDAVFVEDVAIVEPDFAVLTRPGALPRRGEVQEMLPVLKQHFERVYRVDGNATLDGGDICKADDVYYLGLSDRTNLEGAQQLAAILNHFDYRSELIDIRPMEGILHLKSAVNYLGDNTMLLDPRLAELNAFAAYHCLVVPLEEAYAANCLRVNDVVLVPAGFPKTSELLQSAGFQVELLDVSEYQKMDGGLSCLSLRW
jgi:dimethylargininase